MTNKPHALYIHIPFCNYICSYCDFPKLQYFTTFSLPYLGALKNELDSYKIKKEEIETIYIGGGTPTSLSDEEFRLLLEIVKPFSKNVKEFTIEANPESLTISKLNIMKQFGVNRLSIGVESTDDKVLKAVNRHHTFSDVKCCIKNAKKIGINNISVDLILGLPNVSKKMLEKDLKNIFDLPITHFSAYSLTVHEHTEFGIKNIEPADEDAMREFYDIIEAEISKKGFIHYEISNYCKPGYESLHNYTYWKDEEYYGIGLGASGFIDNIRYRNTRSINDYLNGKRIVEKEVISKKDNITYFIMLNLRTHHGLDLKKLKALTNYDLLLEKADTIKRLEEEQLINFDGNVITCTYNGMMLLDQILLSLI